MASDPPDSSASGSSESQRLRDEKLASLKRLAYGASHEINNPLANIASRAQALLASETNPDRRHELATIYAQAMRGYEMIADLMLFARPPVPQPKPCRLSDIAADTMRQMLPAARQQHTVLKLTAPEHEIELHADANQLTLALCALVRNSLEALQKGGQIVITLAETDQSAIMSVQDDGPGIPAEAIDVIFDPFHSGREAGRGLGFGLTKCWTIAQAHGGNVYVDSSVTPLAKVVLEIPLSPHT
ncbi:sensor histidine kinase [Bremerella cremea]|uniref:histidine kinase n=1 Tax=Bremerella cremea TaxID=1031537 RepID=A0A368KR78_9BACT|nr:HAMP domain-containing sensor histidine kinase [Bremerella cremea]RCS49311.1 sensor histidine kinase [Bremerella cremea]